MEFNFYRNVYFFATGENCRFRSVKKWGKRVSRFNEEKLVLTGMS